MTRSRQTDKSQASVKTAAKPKPAAKTRTASQTKVAITAKPVRDDFVEYLVDVLAELGPIDTKRFFSGTGLLLDGTQFAFIIRGTLWMRVDEAGRTAFLAAGSGPFTYRTSQREVALTGYYAVPASMLEDADELADWTRRAFHIALADREMKAQRGQIKAKKATSSPPAK
jgi:TfoX/Sxy family transcriptional regulator of competence genes